MTVQMVYPACPVDSPQAESPFGEYPGRATCSPVCHITYTRDTWVALLRSPSPYAACEAMLLCQDTPHTWVTWVPDYGEIVLDRSHFYCV